LNREQDRLSDRCRQQRSSSRSSFSIVDTSYGVGCVFILPGCSLIFLLISGGDGALIALMFDLLLNGVAVSDGAGLILSWGIGLAGGGGCIVTLTLG